MKKIWNFIYKYRIFIAILFLLIMGTFGYLIISSYLSTDDPKVVYGDRLNGIEDVPITDKKKIDIESKIKERENITSVNISLQGAIINISIVAEKDNNKIDAMKEMGKEILKEFTEQELKFYDIQFFIKNVDENYNMMGYKNKKSETISWTSDEIVSEVEENEEEEK